MTARCALLGSLLFAATARAHDLGVDLNAAFTQVSANNPRTGALGLGITGAWDISERLALFGLASYTRDLATRTATTASSGSDIFRFSLGGQWLPHEQWMLMASATFSPPSAQASATTRLFEDPLTRDARLVDVVVDSRAWNLGGTALVAWASDDTGPLQSTVDVGAGATRFDIFQQLRLGDGVAGRLIRNACEGRSGDFCQLVQGASTPLWQVRLSAGYTATLKRRTDLGAELGVFLYDRDPADVGYFSIVSVGRETELGSGVPVLPLRLSLRPAITHRFEKLTVRLAYQWGLYASNLGAMHSLSGRLTWKVTPAWRLSFSVTGQLDVDSTRAVVNRGGLALVGALYVF